MNLLGVALVAKGLKEASRGGYGGSYRSYSSGPSPEEILLTETRKTLLELEGKEGVSGTEVPAVTLKGMDKLSRKKRKNQKLHNLQILESDPNGVKMDGVSMDLSAYSIVGTIDGSRFFALNKTTKEMVVINITEYTDYGPHGDFTREKNLLNSEPVSDETSEIAVNFTVVKEDGVKSGYKTNMPQKRVYLDEIDKHRDVASFFELATVVRQRAKERQANANASSKGE